MQELVSVMSLAALSWNGTRVEHLFLSWRFELFSSYHSDASHPTHYKEKNPVIVINNITDFLCPVLKLLYLLQA